MKKSLIVLSAITALTITSFASDLNKEMLNQIQTLKAQIEALEKKVEEQQKQQPAVTVVDEKRIEKIEKKLDTVSKTATAAKIQSGNDNLKWDVDFRTQVDNIQYKHADGSKSENNALLTNRLWLGMGYKADENSSFHGKLSYNKAFGDTADHSQSNVNPGYASFDWVTNENATDNTIKLKEAYWLYSNDTFLSTDVPWNASVGRRPSTDGLPINLRNDQKANSPLSHIVDVEFDGFSIRFDTEAATGFRGSWFKICGGRGLTNAIPRFDMSGTAYAEDDTKNVDVDLLGIIAVPYDDGQYSVHMNYAKAWNLIGFTYGDMYDGDNSNNAFVDSGNIDFATVLFKTEGIGNGISDYLDDTVAFASFAASKTNPNANGDPTTSGMLGSQDSEVGTSVWLGINAPCPISPDDSRIGVEWNKGSKYWRSMTYGEDTYAGSKIATRGQAWEVYRNQKLTDALSFGLSYVYMQYDYTGSNSFFGADGTPMTMAQAQAAGQNPVESAQDIRAYMRYRF